LRRGPLSDTLLRALRALATTTLLVLLLASTPARAEPIPAGMEARVAALVAGAGGDATIGPTSIRIALEREPGAFVVLRRRGVDDPAGAKLGETRSFSVWLLPADAPQAKARALFKAIDERDDGTFFDEARARSGGADAANAKSRGPLDVARRLALWAVAIASVVVIYRRARRRTVAVAGLVLVGALLVRWAFPAGPIHANGHGVAELRGLVGWPGFDAFEPESDRYGDAHRQLVRWLAGSVDAVLRLQGLFGALGVVALFALAMALVGSLPAASCAALVGALFPAHVWLSVTESPMPLAGALWLGGTALWLAGQGWGGAAMLALSCELGVTTLALPFAAAGMVLVMRPEAWRRLLGPLALVAVAVALQVDALAPVFAETAARRAGEGAGSLDRLVHGGLLAATPVLAWALLAAGLVGLVVGARARPRTTAAILLGVLVAFTASVWVNVALTDRVRYQAVPMLPLALLAGLACVEWRSWKVVIPAAFAAALGWSTWTVASTPTLEQAAWRRVRDAKWPEKPVVHVPARRLGPKGAVISEFPEYLLPPGARVVPRPPTGPGEGCFVWLGPACASFVAGEDVTKMPRFEGDPIRPDCVEYAAHVESSQAEAMRAGVPWREGEFHRIHAERPVVGLFPCR
jgi:hypothetical protein